jgi:hypothetical protein
MNQNVTEEIEFQGQPKRVTKGSSFLKEMRSLRILCSLAAVFLGVFPIQGCTSTSENVESSIPLSPLQDAEYAPVFEKWNREAHIVDQFQKRIDMHAVLLTDEFRRAYAARWQRLRGDTNARLPEEMLGGKLGVFVSVFTPDRPFLRLDDKNLWSIRLRYGPTQLTPSVVKSLREKEYFEPYFPFVSLWTSEFLLVFDVAPSESAPNANLALPQTVHLEMNSSLTKLDLGWK